MRARTWLLVGAVAIIGLAAVADSVRSRLERGSTVERTADEEGQPILAGASGVLYYTDEFCALRAVRLPEAKPTAAPARTGCGLVLSPDGLAAGPEGTRWAPRGRLRVASSGALLQVFSRTGPVSGPFVAGAPAFKPDGTLTFFRDGRVVEWQTERVVLTQRRLRATVRRALGAPRPRRVTVRELAWLSDSRAVAILAWGPEEVLTVFEGREVVVVWPSLRAGFGRLWSSPRGSYFAVETEGVLLFDRDGRQLPTARFSNFRGLAWSPDERWLAVAAGERILLVATRGRPRPPLRLEIEAQDVFWRAA